MKYPLLQQPAPWNHPNELGVPVDINGTVITAVPSFNAITGDVLLGEIGFEGDDLYILAELQDVAPLGDLHGLPVTVGSNTYRIRNVRPKENVDLIRLVLEVV